MLFAVGQCGQAKSRGRGDPETQEWIFANEFIHTRENAFGFPLQSIAQTIEFVRIEVHGVLCLLPKFLRLHAENYNSNGKIQLNVPTIRRRYFAPVELLPAVSPAVFPVTMAVAVEVPAT